MLPETCIGCQAQIKDDWAPHLAFMQHLDEHPDCAFDYGLWRQNVRDDWGGQ